MLDLAASERAKLARSADDLTDLRVMCVWARKCLIARTPVAPDSTLRLLALAERVAFDAERYVREHTGGHVTLLAPPLARAPDDRSVK